MKPIVKPARSYVHYVQALPLAHAAIYIGVTKSRLTRMTELGYIKSHILDGEDVWTTEDLDAYVLGRKKAEQRDELRRRRQGLKPRHE